MYTLARLYGAQDLHVLNNSVLQNTLPCRCSVYTLARLYDAQDLHVLNNSDVLQ